MFRKRLPPVPSHHELALSLARQLGTGITTWGPAFSYWHGVVLPYQADYRRTPREAHERFCNGVLIVTTDDRLAFIAESEDEVTVLDIALDWISDLEVQPGPLPERLQPVVSAPYGRPTLTIWLTATATRTSQPFPGGPLFSQFHPGSETAIAFAVAQASMASLSDACAKHLKIPETTTAGDDTMSDFLDDMCIACMAYVPLGDRFCASCGAPAPHAHLLDEFEASEDPSPELDPSDVLVAHVTPHEALRSVTLELLLDYQGGGLGGSQARSEWLQHVPIPADQEVIRLVAEQSLGAFDAGATSVEALSEAIANSATARFAPHVSPASLAFRGLAETTAAAFLATVRRDSLDQAAMILLMGCTLLQKAHGWSSLREQGR